jgi:transcriptional regulator with XRE-family HTH domain
MIKEQQPSLLGERVLILRRRAGLTQRQLADACGLQFNTIARLERGGVQDLRGQHIASIARALGTSPDHLLGFEEDTKDQQESASQKPGRKRKVAS